MACLMQQYDARGFFLHGTPLLKLYGFCLSRLLERHIPELHQSLEGLDEVLGFKWFGTLFTTVLPFEVALRAWDLLFHDGLLALLRLALGVCALLAPALLAAEGEGEELVDRLGRLQRELPADAAPLLRPPRRGGEGLPAAAGEPAAPADGGRAAARLAGNRLVAAAESFRLRPEEFEGLLVAWKRERPEEAADLGQSGLLT